MGTKPKTSKGGMVLPWVTMVALLVATACGSGDPSSPGSSTSDDVQKTVPALKLDVLDAVGGHLLYCDPDEFPLPSESALASARARLDEIRSDHATLQAILQHEGFSDSQAFTPEQIIAINEDYKQMQAIDLRPADDGYSFRVLVKESGADDEITRVSGTVSRSSSVTIDRREAGRQPNCPICLAAGVRIATPNGHVPIQDIRPGMRVWTSNRHGRRVVGVVLETGHMETPLGHDVVRLAMADGRTVTVSPGHPTGDGRTVGDLEPGDAYDRSVVTGATIVPYVGTTWDLLPSGPTATYFANGVRLGSTLAGARDQLVGR